MRKKTKNKSPNFILVFIISLAIVLVIGFGSIFLWSNFGNAGAENAAEAIEENNFAEETQQADADSQTAETVEVRKITDEDRKNAKLNGMGGSTSSTASADDDDGNNTCTLEFAGDILFDSRYSVMNTISSNGGALSSVMDEKIINELRGADIAMLNNEFPYTDRGNPTLDKKYTFHVTPSASSFLKDMGIDIVTLANNHAYDYGETGLLDTLDTLDSAGVVYAGAGKNIEEASSIRYFEKNGVKIAIIAATDIEQMDNPDTKGATESSPGVFRAVDDTLLLQRIKEAKSTGAFTIVFIHWGSENKEELSWLQEQQAPEFSEAGADLIIGAHPHILQKIGYEDDTAVVYSLGNFLFNSRQIDTGIIKVTVGKDGLDRLQFLPAVQKNCRVAFAEGEDRTRILDKMVSISPEATIDDNGYITQK